MSCLVLKLNEDQVGWLVLARQSNLWAYSLKSIELKPTKWPNCNQDKMTLF
ncbi:hypothetical protein ACE6H2_003626 [Prunus campanulata]